MKSIILLITALLLLSLTPPSISYGAESTVQDGYAIKLKNADKEAANPNETSKGMRNPDENASEEDKSLLQKEFDTVPEPDSYTEPDDGWLGEGETGRDKDREKKLQQRIVTTFFALIIVIVLIFIVIKFLASGKINIPSLGIGKHAPLIKILDKSVLQPGKILYMVNAAGKTLLIGVADGSIHSLAEIPEETIEKYRAESQANPAEGKTADLTLFPAVKPQEKEDSEA